MPRFDLSRAIVPITLGLASLATAACEGEATTAAGGNGGSAGTSMSTSMTTSGDASSSGTGIGPGEKFTVSFGPVTVPPGTEKTECVVKQLTNETAKYINQIHNELNSGSHHLIVYRTNDTVEQPTPFACQPFADLLDPAKGTPLMITQKADELLTLPQGVAFKIGAKQFVRLEMHYINATAAPLDVAATSTFVAMDDKDFQNEADFLFFGNPDIDIAPMSAFTLGPTYLPMPSQVAGSKLFGFAGHTHHWGTNVTVATTTGKTGTDTPVYDVPNWKWDEPETVYHDPAVEVPANGGFRFTCTYENGSPEQVGFGESANDEMCFFWAYYYPSKGAFVCAHTDQVAGGYDLCCPGNPFCDQIFN